MQQTDTQKDRHTDRLRPVGLLYTWTRRRFLQKQCKGKHTHTQTLSHTHIHTSWGGRNNCPYEVEHSDTFLEGIVSKEPKEE